jgi:uncharacterized integral membrane protein (TIGR00698 family)
MTRLRQVIDGLVLRLRPVLGRWREAAARIAPGVALSLVIAMAATFLSDHHGGPTLLYALLIGMAFHFLSQEARWAKGIDFSVRTILRIGVAMLGARISVAEIAEMGFSPIAIVVAGVTATIVLGVLAAPRLSLSKAQGVLTGGAVAICGASAALAISAVLPKSSDTARETLFTVVAVTLLSTLAMVLYPLLVRALGYDDRAAGILLGATIHDVAQVVGAGYLISEQAGLIATYVKLLRVSTLLPVVLVLAWYFAAPGGHAASRWRLLPSFLLAFAILAAANSAGLVPRAASETMASLSRWCLVCAIAGLGMKTSLQELSRVGWRPLALVTAETLFLLGLVLAALEVLGRT